MILVLTFASGLLVGLGYFGSLGWLCHHLIGVAGHQWWPLLSVHLVRIVLLTSAAIVAVGYGAATLITFALGITVVRIVLVSKIRRQVRGEPSC